MVRNTPNICRRQCLLTDLYLYNCVHLRCIRLCTCIQSNQRCLYRSHSSDSHGYHYCTHQNLKEKGKGLHVRAQFQFYEETKESCKEFWQFSFRDLISCLKVACVASVSVRFRSKERGTGVKDRATKWRNLTETLATQASLKGKRLLRPGKKTVLISV